MKRFGISSLLLLASLLRPAATDAQIYAKLNVLYALVGVVNPAVEFRLTDHSAFQTEFVYSPWKSINVDGQSKPMHFGIFLNEYRYYFRGYARGWYVGFTGVLTFKNARRALEAAAAVPRDRVVIETDCPYMSPEPFRGKRNDPTRLYRMAEALASIWSVSPEEAQAITFENGKRLYGI